MRVAISTLPLKTAHKNRGIGYYTHHLLELLKSDNSVEVFEFTKLSELKNADVVHYPWFDFFFRSLPIKKKFPTLVTIHDVIPLIFPKYHPVGLRGKINFLIQKIALKSCRFVITDSQNSKNDIVNYLKVSSDKVKVVHLAQDEKFRVLNDAKLIQIKRKNNLPDRFLLYVGDANWVKNLPFLIKGYKEIIKDPNLGDVKLILIGGVFLKNVGNIKHPELESLKQVARMINDFGLNDRIIRPGHIEDEELVAFYNLATAYIQPSLYEGFGLPVLQAFACGTPVICSNAGSLPEIGGQSAVYFDPQNLDQFIAIVEEILQNKSLREKLSKMGIKRAKEFSWEKVAEETKQVYIKALQTENK